MNPKRHYFGYWFALGNHWTNTPNLLPELLAQREAVKTLRALSHTCRRLRSFSLPLLWQVVHIRTVEHLGQLRECLRMQPGVAPLIRRFTFAWHLSGGEYWKCEPYAGPATTLDMAFIDRGAQWDQLLAETGSVQEEVGSYQSHFMYAGMQYDEPGQPAEGPEYDEDEGTRNWRSGPDGLGPDAYIKSASDFNAAIDEILAQLVSLENFECRCPVTSVPAGAFEALKSRSSLDALHLDVRSARRYPPLGE